MDYSQIHSGILFRYYEMLIGIIIVICACVLIAVQMTKEHLKYTKRIDYVTIMVIGLVLLGIIYAAKGYILDIPNAIYHNFYVTSGTSIVNDLPENYIDSRSIMFKRDDNGEIISVTVMSYPIHKGDRFSIMYLPHSGIGEIVEELN